MAACDQNPYFHAQAVQKVKNNGNFAQRGNQNSADHVNRNIDCGTEQNQMQWECIDC